MKLLSASIFTSSLIISVSMYVTFSNKVKHESDNFSVIDENLLPDLEVITEKRVREVFMTDDAQAKLKHYFEAANIAANPKEIHAIIASLDGDYVAVEYLYEDQGFQSVMRVFLSEDDFGNLVAENLRFPITVTSKRRTNESSEPPTRPESKSK